MFDIIFERYIKKIDCCTECHKAKSFRNKFYFANEKERNRDSIDEKKKEKTNEDFSTN